MQSDWAVTYGGGFWAPHGSAGTPVAVDKHFTWAGEHFYIPAIYTCQEGFVVDICKEVNREPLCAFLEKWVPQLAGQHALARELREKVEAENPMTTDFYIKAAINGQAIVMDRGCGIGWIPSELVPPEERNERAEMVLNHYGLVPSQGWFFRRISFKWPQNGPKAVNSLSLSLISRPKSFPGKPFTMPQKGESVELQHPLREEIYTLTVEKIRHEQLPDHLAGENRTRHAVLMACTLAPDLDREHFRIRDTVEDERNEQKERAASMGIIGGADGPTAIAFLTPNQPKLHCAISSMRFQPPETVVWQPIFRETLADDLTVELL